MSSTIFSLLVVTTGFCALVLWVFWPSRRQEIETHGQIPFIDDLTEISDE